MAISDTLAQLTDINDQLTQIENAQALSLSIRQRCTKLGVAVPPALDTVDASLAVEKDDLAKIAASAEVAASASKG